ncbi:HNH endonuclease signature motif containing protein [Paenibacillus aquistagni]|uniref:HNH endonuclease n=1 Tax=Paenibacillus aquistagni TaxID=1852522 RepID=A0A1X7LX54_9BACL|nr:HNH endonuclease signature motif containing protein [Paenibacillus aquistagni]SMG58270.1 HNH endonuclease [Paenibacillus aquistagni]
MAKFAILQSFYASKEWRTFRANLILERGNCCERCKEVILRPVDIIGHHIIELTPENVHDHTISLNPENVELICYDCHNIEHNRFGHQGKKQVFMVYGAPFSGKAALVHQQMKRGDLIVDMDRLYEAISGLSFYDKPDNLFSNVIAVHNLLLDNIKTRMGKWNNAWIIGGHADKFKRERLANDLGADLIFCSATIDECFARLEEDEDRRYRKTEWKKYIEKWFEQYCP